MSKIVGKENLDKVKVIIIITTTIIKGSRVEFTKMEKLLGLKKK